MRPEKKRKYGPMAIIGALLWGFCGAPAPLAAADDCAALARQVGHGGIVWTENAIVVQGTAAPNVADPDTPLSVIKRMTQSAATLDAYRKAAGILTGIRVSSQAIAADHPRVVTRIEAFVQNARVCDAKYFADGGVDMVVMVPISGAFAMEALPGAGTRVAAGPSNYTGLVVDARHLAFAPAIVPRLMDQAGTILLDAPMVRAEVIQGRGAARYSSSSDPLPADFLGQRPFQAKALALGAASPSDLVLDPEAAAVLAGAPSFLGEGRVVIVIADRVPVDCGASGDTVTDRHVDWERKLVFARGRGRVDFSRQEDVSVRMRKMERAAEVDAQRKLLEAFLGVGIDGRKTVKSLPDVAERARGVILNAVRCGAKYFKDGSAEVVMAAPLDALAAVALSLGQGEPPAAGAPQDGFTGVIVDAGGLGFEPVLAPRIKSQDGRLLYGPELVARAYVQNEGIAGYRPSLDDARRDQRVGARPLVVKALPSAFKAPGELAVDGSAARALTEMASRSGALSRGRVIIVTENTGRLEPTPAGAEAAPQTVPAAAGPGITSGPGPTVKVGTLRIP